MKMPRSISLLLVALMLVGSWATSALARDEAKDVRDSADVLAEVMKIPEKGIPPALLRDAKAVVIIPDMIKGAFIVGGRHGTGVLVVKKRDGSWADPLFVRVSGPSFGWQVGGKSTDLIMVFKTERDVEALMKRKFTLGADASVAAGPVGRTGEAATDVMLKSSILAYSRSRGLFAGASLEGAALMVSKDANASYYGKPLTADEVIAGKGGHKSEDTKRLQHLLDQYSHAK